jgi:5-methyltetrahydropteroyltriglutamate--homocysteine methyltransferase
LFTATRRLRRSCVTVETTVVGSYPKPPHERGDFVLRRILNAVDRGAAAPEDVLRAQEELAREVIAEQEAAGIDIVTDGGVRWDDLVTPFARNMAGFEIGGLLRFFDNNVYYRRPVCTGPVEWRRPATVEAYSFAASVATCPVKAVICGPVTFAHLCIDEHYGDHEAFVLAIAEVLAQEAFELKAAGAKHIQIDEPALLGAPEDLDLAGRALEVVMRDLGDVDTTLATYFGDAKRIGPELFSLPVETFGLDLVAGPENAELIDSLPPDRGLQAGLVDARDTRLEPVDELAHAIQRLVGRIGAGRLRVSPSCGLEFLPRDRAEAKLKRLSEAVKKVGE